MSSEGSSSERVLRWIPAIAALALATLYSVGALLTAAGLRGAGLSVKDSLSLFSLEKFLARGISTLVASIVLLVVLVLLGMLAVGAGRAVRRRDWSQRQATAATVASALVALAVLAFSSPVLAAALILSFAVGVFAPRWYESAPRVGIWAAQYLIVLAGLIASAFVYPEPLPVATVEAGEESTPIVGDLVTNTDFTWYVAGFEDDEVRAIPAADIVDARYVSRERETPPALKDLVSDLLD